MTWTPSDAQIEAAVNALDHAEKNERWNPMQTHRQRLIEHVLIAAHAAAPPVDTTEFEAALQAEHLAARHLGYQKCNAAWKRLGLEEERIIEASQMASDATQQRLRDLYVKASGR